MKSKDLQNILLPKNQKRDTPTGIHHHLNGAVSLAMIKRLCQTIRQSGFIQLLGARAAAQIVRTKENTQKAKDCLHRKQKVSARKLLSELSISATGVRRI